MTSENLAFLTPYENLLLTNETHVHQVLQDILNCRLEAIRRTKPEDMEKIINLFKGRTPNQKREELVEFLKLMPEYKTTDQDVLYRRLKALKDQIKAKEGVSDLYFYAMRKYRRTSTSESDA